MRKYAVYKILYPLAELLSSSSNRKQCLGTDDDVECGASADIGNLFEQFRQVLPYELLTPALSLAIPDQIVVSAWTGQPHFGINHAGIVVLGENRLDRRRPRLWWADMHKEPSGQFTSSRKGNRLAVPCGSRICQATQQVQRPTERPRQRSPVRMTCCSINAYYR